MNQREIEASLPQFEGLVFETARQIHEAGAELEIDDLRQLLRIKVWYAVQRFNDQHPKGMTLRKFVFMCVRNLRKDIEKRPRRNQASIDAIRDREMDLGANCAPNTAGGNGTLADWFDSRYLSVGTEQVFGSVDDDVELPSSLTEIERRLIELRLAGRWLLEIDLELGISRAQRERLMRSVREKLTSIDPGAQEPRSAPLKPLAGVEPRKRLPARVAA